METYLRASSPYSEGWIAWVMLLILCCIVISVWLQPSIIKNSFHNLFENRVRGNQLYSTSFTFIGSGLLLLSQACTFAMFIYIDYAYTHHFFHITAYLLTGALFLGMWIVQDILLRFISFVFFNKEVLQTYRYYRLTLNTCFTLIIYPILLLIMFTNWIPTTSIHIIIIAILITLFILIAIKLFRLFSPKILDCFYILLYLCTLEILPYLGWIEVTRILLSTMSL